LKKCVLCQPGYPIDPNGGIIGNVYDGIIYDKAVDPGLVIDPNGGSNGNGNGISNGLTICGVNQVLSNNQCVCNSGFVLINGVCSLVCG